MTPARSVELRFPVDFASLAQSSSQLKSKIRIEITSFVHIFSNNTFIPRTSLLPEPPSFPSHSACHHSRPFAAMFFAAMRSLLSSPSALLTLSRNPRLPASLLFSSNARGMKTRSSVKRLCDACKPVRRKNRVYIIWCVGATSIDLFRMVLWKLEVVDTGGFMRSSLCYTTEDIRLT